MKARIGPAETDLQDALSNHYVRAQSAPASINSFPAFEDLPRNDSRLDMLFSHASADFLLNGGAVLTMRDSLSFTTWSQGLPVNVRHGGLKKDLSLYLQNPDNSDPDNALYFREINHGRPPLSTTQRGGINFRELYTFHELPNRLSYNAGSFSHLDGGGINSAIPAMVGANERAAAAFDPFIGYLRPMVLRSSWIISLWSELADPPPADPDEEEYDVYLVIEPIVWLWNPFDAHLVLQPDGHLQLKAWGLPYTVNLFRDGESEAYASPRFNQVLGGANQVQIGLNVGSESSVIMRPGEILMLSLGQNALTPVKDNPRDMEFVAELGYSGTGGFARPIPGGRLQRGQTIAMGMTAATNTTNADRGANGGLTTVHSFVGREISNTNRYMQSTLATNRQPTWYPGGGLLSPVNDFQPQGMFQHLPKSQFYNVEDLASPQPVGIFSFRARTENQAVRQSRIMARLNPFSGGYSHNTVDNNTIHSLPYEAIMEPLNSFFDNASFSFDGGRGFYGSSYVINPGQSYIITHSIPRDPPISLGAFQHALANGVRKWIYTVDVGSELSSPPGTFPPGSEAYTNYILQPSITHAIGNSFAPPAIPRDSVHGSFNLMNAVDHSWLANDALWDSWFVSSIATRNAPHLSAEESGTARQLFENFAGAGSTNRLLPNRAFRYTGKDPQADLDRLFNGNTPSNNAHELVASMLGIHGAFNVNSTNPQAWLAMLKASQGRSVPVFSRTANGSTWAEAEHPVHALLQPHGEGVETSHLNTRGRDSLWTGYRDLEDGEMEELAEQLVVEIRKRGPFLSLADFINRRLSNDNSLAKSGALQTALDATVNDTLETGSGSIGNAEAGVAFPQAEAGSPITQVPAHVKQGDLLTTIGTRLAPRSDTFKIRAYGEARATDGTVIARAACEAVIQRTTEFTDPTNPPETPQEALSPTNRDFGRKFEIHSFRWLSNKEYSTT